jgi:UDP-N-acetylmuramoyl-tripeptide--D-alanyl-D-alanine ligase
VRPRSLERVAAVTGGSVRPPEAAGTVATGVSVNSRQVEPGDLFVALPGERSDGHRYVPDALARGAAGAVVRRGGVRDPVGGPVVEVDDPGRALRALAADERSLLSATVVGITGSTGKTSTKDLSAAVLRRRFRVSASPASFNNEVGLPLTVLRADPEVEVLVCEMGSRGRGHIRLLCEVARPHIGVITNIGVAHLELFGSREALRDAKAELPEALPPDGTAVLNADDPVARTFAERTPARTVVLYGTSPEAQVRATSVRLAPRTGRACFELLTPAGSARVELAVPGEHMVPNALAAAAVGWVLGVSPDDIALGLETATVSSGRMEVAVGPGGVRVVDDSYNANPTSMAAALKAARWMAGDGRCIAVLGPMAELGPISAQEHQRVGELVARLGVEELVAVGPEGRLIARGAEREGVEPDRIHLCEGAEEAAAVARSLARPGDLVLVKASRVVGLERVARALLEAPGERA